MKSPFKFIQYAKGRFLTYPLLLIIPLVLFFTSLDTIRSREKAWYAGGYDPEYAYLFNALNMATFRLAGHIDHPGTTTQVAGGVVLRIAWWIDSRGDDLTSAVLTDPEHYIRILNITTAVIGSLALLLLGWFLTASVGIIWVGLLLQLTPFISGFVLFNGFTKITQEVMLMSAAFAMAALALHWYFKAKNEGKVNYWLWFAVIAGFGMASKILFVPLMIIPLILLVSVKEKVRFLLASGLSFIVFTLPVIKLYPNILYWIYRLFVHSGQYGTGSKEVIDTSRYIDDLLNLFIVSPVLAVIFGLSVIVLLGFSLFRLVKKHYPDTATVKLLMSVVLAQAAGYLLVAKQPKEAYLLPYECIAAVNVVILLHLTGSHFPNKLAKAAITGVVTLFFIITAIPYGLARKQSTYSTERNPVWENAWQAATGYPGREAIVCANPGSSPIAGLYFGNAYSRRRYVTDLQKIYPDFYIMDGIKGHIYHWGNEPVSIDALFKKYKERIIYIGQHTPGPVVARLLEMKTPGWNMQPVYTDDYQMLMAPVSINQTGLPEGRKLIFTAAEASPLDPEKPVTCPEIPFPGLLSYEKAYSGHSSIMTNVRSPYALSVDPEILKAGDKIEVSVLASGNPDDLRIVVSGENSDDLYITSIQEVKTKTSDWVLLELKMVIPETMEGKRIKVYAWNKGEHIAYFDNFRMEIYRPLINLIPANEPVIGK